MKYVLILLIASCKYSHSIEYSGRVYDPLITCVRCDTVPWREYWVLPSKNVIGDPYRGDIKIDSSDSMPEIKVDTSVYNLHLAKLIMSPCLQLTNNSDSSYTITIIPGCKFNYILSDDGYDHYDTIYIKNMQAQPDTTYQFMRERVHQLDDSIALIKAETKWLDSVSNTLKAKK